MLTFLLGELLARAADLDRLALIVVLDDTVGVMEVGVDGRRVEDAPLPFDGVQAVEEAFRLGHWTRHLCKQRRVRN